MNSLNRSKVFKMKYFDRNFYLANYVFNIISTILFSITIWTEL